MTDARERNAAYARKHYAANREKIQARQREYNAVNKDKRNARQRKNKYGLSHEQFDAMLQSQNFACAICLSDTPGGRGTFHVDHCHSTGIVRGLLCYHCNLMLGHARDKAETLTSAISYLAAADAGRTNARH